MPNPPSDAAGRPWICYWHFVGWDCLSLGVSVCWSALNIEIHLPFGFVRVGREGKPILLEPIND